MSAAGKLGWGHYVIQSPSLPTWAVGVKFVKEKPNLLKGATGKRESPREQSLLRKLCANPTCVCVCARACWRGGSRGRGDLRGISFLTKPWLRSFSHFIK